MSTDIQRRLRTSEVMLPADLGQTKAQMDLYQRGVHSLMDDTDWQTFETTVKQPDGSRRKEERRFLKRSGWRKIATWFQVDLEERAIEVDRDLKGNPIRARAVCRAIAPNGRFADGSGACSLNERAFSKPEHDIPATASTRAMNRAISNLVGLGALSAEEMDGADGAPEPDASQAPGLPYGPPANGADEKAAAGIIQTLHPSIDGFALLDLLKKSLGVDELPEAAFRTLKALEWGAGDGAGKVSGSEREEPQKPADEPTDAITEEATP